MKNIKPCLVSKACVLAAAIAVGFCVSFSTPQNAYAGIIEPNHEGVESVRSDSMSSEITTSALANEDDYSAGTDTDSSSSGTDSDAIIQNSNVEEEAQLLSESNDMQSGHLKSSDDNTDDSALGDGDVIISYKAHVENIGWQDPVTEGEAAGTTGRALSLESLIIEPKGFDAADLHYQVHVENIGWQDSVSGGEQAGTTGRALQVEALKIWLTGDMAEKYDIYYRGHVRDIGWMGWTSNGSLSGTTGMGYGMEAIQIELCKKQTEDEPPNDESVTIKAAIVPSTVTYGVHVQDIGWMDSVSNGRTAGTTGRGLQLEALIMGLEGYEYSLDGSISYDAHVANIGWQPPVAEGEIAGTTGQGRQIEALAINIDGDLADYFNIYYRVHIENYGWLDWAMNGQVAGSTGIGYQAEAVEVRLVPKGNPAPGPTNHYYTDKKKHRGVGISLVLGINADEYIAYLESHEHDGFYVGTIYRGGDWRSPHGDTSYNGGIEGTNCTGFVWHTYVAAGADPWSVPHMTGYSYCAGGWGVLLNNPAVPEYNFSSKEEMLSSGVLSKGDIIWIWDVNNGGRGASIGTNHVGIFWGDTPSQDRFWHSPSYGNVINGISSGAVVKKYTVLKL